LLQDGDIEIGVFREREEILVGSEGASAGGIGGRNGSPASLGD